MLKALFLLLLTCCTHAPARWYLDSPQEKQGKIYLPARDGLSMEIILSCGTEWGYINHCVFGFTEKTVPITIAIDESAYSFCGVRLEGCQRVLMPAQATQLLIKALLDGHQILLTAGPYQTNLEAHNFAHLYGKLNQL